MPPNHPTIHPSNFAFLCSSVVKIKTPPPSGGGVRKSARKQIRTRPQCGTAAARLAAGSDSSGNSRRQPSRDCSARQREKCRTSGLEFLDKKSGLLRRQRLTIVHRKAECGHGGDGDNHAGEGAGRITILQDRFSCPIVQCHGKGCIGHDADGHAAISRYGSYEDCSAHQIISSVGHGDGPS